MSSQKSNTATTSAAAGPALEATDAAQETAEIDETNISDLTREMGIESENTQLHVAPTVSKQIRVVTPAKYAHFHCPNTIPVPEYWPNRPLLMRESNSTNPLSCEPPIPTDGTVVPFESDLFQGQVIMRLVDNPKCESYFKGKRRLNSVVVTGRFKRRICFADMVTGQEFCHPIKNPGRLLTRGILAAFKMLAPLLKVRIDDETYFLSPLAQSVQAMNVSATPFELTPDCVVEENTTLLGGALAVKPLDFSQRKKFFSNELNLAKYSYDTENYYTFDFYNDKIDLRTFELNLLSRKFDITPYLLGQPIRIIARAIDENPPTKGDSRQESELSKGLPGYAWNFELWHEKQARMLERL